MHPDGPIWGHGWDDSGWPERTAPSTHDLDSVVGDRPTYLARIDAYGDLFAPLLETGPSVPER